MKRHARLRAIVSAVGLFVPIGAARASDASQAKLDAGIAVMRFEKALDAQKWDDALEMCSDRVRGGAAKWPSAEAFFRETVPLDRMLAYPQFAYFREQHDGTLHRYGMFVVLTPPTVEPRVDWIWSVETAGTRWTIDFDPKPIKLDELIAQKKAEIAKQQEHMAQLRKAVEPKLRGVKTQLTAISERLEIGAPMIFRLELMNFGDEPIHFRDSGCSYESLVLMNDKRESIPFDRIPAMIGERVGELGPRSTTVLAGEIDLAKQFKIAKPGKYYVQFTGLPLVIGEPMTVPKDAQRDEYQTFVGGNSQFPSNILEIEVNEPNH
jgi:hypothetical protein